MDMVSRVVKWSIQYLISWVCTVRSGAVPVEGAVSELKLG